MRLPITGWLAALAMAGAVMPTLAQPVSAPGPGVKAPVVGYAGKVRAAILPYVLEPEGLEGNPSAEIKVTTHPDGTVVDVELTRSSGQPAWDVAVRRAVLKARRIPLDIDGKVPPVLYLVFSPR